LWVCILKPSSGAAYEVSWSHTTTGHIR